MAHAVKNITNDSELQNDRRVFEKTKLNRLFVSSFCQTGSGVEWRISVIPGKVEIPT